MADPYYSSVSLLLPMTGANNSTTFTDYSPTPKTVTRYGDAKILTDVSKWGNGSGYFDGTGDYLAVENSNDFIFGANPFTLEALIYPTASIGYQTIISTRDSSYYGCWLGLYSNSLYPCCYSKTSLLALSSISVTLNKLNHVALSRNGANLQLFVNGAVVATATISDNFTSPICTIGMTDSNLFYFQGYLQDVRITHGVARYSADFTPPGRLTNRTMTGNATKIGGGAADQVVIRDATTRELIEIVVPASNGDWTADVLSGDYDITYFASGCQPICHGPYTVA